MKKLIILLAFLITGIAQAQYIDTANWSLTRVSSDGTYRLLTNRNTYMGKSAGSVVVPLQININAIDTSLWGFKSIGSDGTFRLAYNKSTYYGKAANTVVVQLVYNNEYSIGTATTSGGTATLNTLAGVVTTDNLRSIGSGNITINNSYITTSSVIIITGSGADYLTNQISLGMVSQTSGQITISAIISGGTFTTELQINFLIIN